eukprot:CAMPEP_0178901454 /NCGR_PEP_ID=MMETSP0786-20121207/4031_1 /TAXON_ID=186022 /ORGANISM="Thalassionema frauenfeldii, Strain CCMP 1798" /LENGTH=593 /DNA_ID=CAMNT_0020572557 /DNA_START=148 /DNA_END=1926 /DNA_ORIENTATION=+
MSSLAKKIRKKAKKLIKKEKSLEENQNGSPKLDDESFGKKHKKNKRKGKKLAKKDSIEESREEIHEQDNSVLSDSSLVGLNEVSLLEEQTTLLACFPTEDPKDTAMHVACSGQFSETLILHLLEKVAFQKMLLKCNDSQQLPLHVALKNKEPPSAELVEAMIDKNAEALKHADKDGNLPLHLVCLAGAPNVVILENILSKYPEACKIQNNLVLPFSGCGHIEEDAEDNLGDESNDPEVNSSWWDSVMAPPAWIKGRNMSSESAIEFSDLSPAKKNLRTETSFTPLHLAVLNYAPAEAIESILKSDHESTMFMTNQNRTALECAKCLVANIYSDDIEKSPLQNSFDSIFLLRNRNLMSRTVRRLSHLAAGDNIEKYEGDEDNVSEDFDAKAKWRTLKYIFLFSNKLKQLGSVNYLGSETDHDSEVANCPAGFIAPSSHDEVVLDTKLPVGFRRLRWALLHDTSKFSEEVFFEHKLNYSDVSIGTWDKFDEHIGNHTSDEGIVESDFVGAEKSYQFLMPASGFVGANMAYVTMKLTEYNDHCFAFDSVSKNPDVPFGKVIECHTKYVFINEGKNETRMISSVHCHFIGKPPMIAW